MATVAGGITKFERARLKEQMVDFCDQKFPCFNYTDLPVFGGCIIEEARNRLNEDEILCLAVCVDGDTIHTFQLDDNCWNEVLYSFSGFMLGNTGREIEVVLGFIPK